MLPGDHTMVIWSVTNLLFKGFTDNAITRAKQAIKGLLSINVQSKKEGKGKLTGIKIKNICIFILV